MVLDSESGEVVFQGRSGAANWSQTPPDIFDEHCREALDGCPHVDAVCGCLSGLLGTKARQEAAYYLAHLTKAPAIAYADYAAAFAASPEGTDLLVIAGTGTLVCSPSQDGGWVKTSGGGPLLGGDPGAVFTICRKTMADLFLTGESEETQPLWNLMEEVWGVREVDDLVGAFYKDPNRSYHACRLIGLILEQWRSHGRPVSDIPGESLLELASLIFHHLGSTGVTDDPVQVCLAGGLWSVDPELPEWFIALLNDNSEPGFFTGVLPEREAVWGACQLARRVLSSSHPLSTP